MGPEDIRVKPLAGALAAALLALVWFTARHDTATPHLARPGDPLTDAVPLIVRETSTPAADQRTFEAEFRGGGEVARFGFSFTPKAVSAASPGVLTTGALISRPGSHTSALLFALAGAHGARAGTIGRTRQESL